MRRILDRLVTADGQVDNAVLDSDAELARVIEALAESEASTDGD